MSPDRAGVVRAVAVARAFGEQTGVGSTTTDSLTIIVEEWLNNVVEHGGVAPGARIVLRLQHGRTVLRLAVSDAGRPFDPRTVQFEGPNLARGGGAGLALILAWCRITNYRRSGGRNRLVFELTLT